jgi:hypothetical protein
MNRPDKVCHRDKHEHRKKTGQGRDD